MGKLAARPILLADADVLIDYAQTERRVLGLISQHVGPLKVLDPVLRTVGALSKTDCRALHIEIVHPSSELLQQAAEERSRVSLEDHLCFLVCRAEGWTCATNDGALIRLCTEGGVSIRRGLRLLLDLVERGVVTRARALDLALAIHKQNPHHINAAVLESFRQSLEQS